MTDTNPKTAFICATCRECNRHGDTHPGVRHQPGICDCPCREETVTDTNELRNRVELARQREKDADLIAELRAEIERLQAEPLFSGCVVDATATARFTIQAETGSVTYPAPNARVVVYAAPTEGP